MKLQKQRYNLLIAIIILLAGPHLSAADRYSVASGNWSNTLTWSSAPGGVPGASVPGATDNVFIYDGYEVSVDFNAHCLDITVGTGTGGVLNIGRRTTQPTSQSLTVHGSMTINAGASVIPRRNNQTHSISVAGNIVNHGTVEFYSLTLNGPVCDVTLNGTGSVSISGTSPVHLNNLTINTGCNASLFSSGNTLYGVLLCNGTLNTGGNLILKSNSLRTALIDGTSSGNVTGSLTMERYIASAFGYKYFSSPFMNSTVGEFADEVDLTAAFPALYSYDEESTFSGWTAYTTATDPLVPLEGYALNLGSTSLPLTADQSGEVNNGSLQITLYNHNNPSTLGFSLAGNPYPSPVDWDAAGWTRSNIDNAVWYFRASSTDQYGGAYSSYVNGVSSDGAATNIIPSMQGFFVHVTDGSYPVTATLGVTNAIRINDLTHAFLKSATVDTRPLLRIYAQYAGDTASADPLAIYFDEAATKGFDSRQDALKILNTDWMMVNLSSLSSDGRLLSINALPATNDTVTVIPLSVLTYLGGEVCISLADRLNLPEGLRVIFYDRLTSAEKDLAAGPCCVSLGAGDYNERFSLILKGGLTSTGPVPGDNDPLFSAYAAKGILKAEIHDLPGKTGRVEIFNLNGSLESSYLVESQGYYEFNTGLACGIYIVRYTSGNIMTGKKILIGE